MGENSKEAKYQRQLEALGIYDEAMDATIHDLCILERECSRARKEWKDTAAPGKAPSALDPHYKVIREQQRDILALRTALGLTPMSLRRIKGAPASESKETESKAPTVLELVLQKNKKQA